MDNKCGECTACCRVFAIKELQPKKKAGVWCEHCDVGRGCRIYEARPESCRDFQCLWLASHTDPEGSQMAGDLRPDRCKVVFSPTTKEGLISATTMPGYPLAWQQGAARRIIETLVRNGVNVVAGAPAATRLTMVTARGTREVEMTEPDEDGMQWSVPNKGGA